MKEQKSSKIIDYNIVGHALEISVNGVCSRLV